MAHVKKFMLSSGTTAEHTEYLPQGPVTEPIEEPSLQSTVVRVPEKTPELRRSTRIRAEQTEARVRFLLRNPCPSRPGLACRHYIPNFSSRRLRDGPQDCGLLNNKGN